MATTLIPSSTNVTTVWPKQPASGTIASSDIGTVDVLWKSGGPTSGTGAWGATANPTTDFITIRYDTATGSSGFVKIEASGDTQDFNLMSVEGDNLDTPATFHAITNDSDHLYIAWKGVTSGSYKQIEIGLRPIYRTGSLASMSLEFFDHEGNSLGSLAASATVADALQGAVEAPGNVVGLWSAKNIANGALSSGDTSLRNIYASAPYADDLKAYSNGSSAGTGRASYTPTVQATAFSAGTISKEVYVDIPASAAKITWPNTAWSSPGDTSLLDSLGTNDNGGIATDMAAFFMVVKNDKWSAANNHVTAWNEMYTAGGPNIGVYTSNGNKYEVRTELKDTTTNRGYARVGFEVNGNQRSSGTYVGVNTYFTIASMQYAPGSTYFNIWVSEVGQPFGSIWNMSPQWDMNTVVPSNMKSWGIWSYGNGGNSVSATRLSVCAVAGWSVGWDEAATNHFATMHAQVT
jgi:hypothetical protein